MPFGRYQSSVKVGRVSLRQPADIRYWSYNVTSVGHSIAFGPFTLDLSTDTLHRDGLEIPLRPQARKVLRALVVQSGVYLDHGQMIRQAWEGILVSKHTVT